MKTTAFLTVAIAFAFATPAMSQSKFEKATADPAKLEKQAKWDFPRERGKNGGGYTAHYETLAKVPSRVALVSISYHDPGYTKSSSTDIAGTKTTTIATVRTPTPIAQTHIDAYASLAVDPIKTVYAEYGMTVLTPEEFLDTPEKKEFYENFQFQKAKSANKLLSKLMTSGTLVSLNLPASGYQEMVIKNEMVVTKDGGGTTGAGLLEAKTKETLESLGHDLCKGLEVDAVLIVYNSHHTENQINVELDYVTMALMGPNPIQLGDDDKKPLVYRKGVYYAVSRIKIKKPTTEKKYPAFNPAGYANIMTAQSHKIGKWMVEKTAKE